jgi:hypothetical protein
MIANVHSHRYKFRHSGELVFCLNSFLRPRRQLIVEVDPILCCQLRCPFIFADLILEEDDGSD